VFQLGIAGSSRNIAIESELLLYPLEELERPSASNVQN
jgi:hypothetical protein